MTVAMHDKAESRARHVAREMTPPALLRLVRNWRKQGLRFTGQPATWEEATRMSGGYDADAILGRVVAATRTVVAGDAAFERDTVLFQEPEYPFPIVAMLLRAALVRGDGVLSVLDFGGSLGSTFRQCRPLLDAIDRLRWCIVEQTHFVAAGRAEFETAELTFAASVADAVARGAPDVVLLLSVLQYLDDPAAVLQRLADSGATTMVVDRTPLTGDDDDHLCIQHVPASIYPASYPCRLFSRRKLLRSLDADWHVVSEFACPEGAWQTDAGVHFAFRGLVLERKTR